MERKPDWLPGFPVQIYCNSSEDRPSTGFATGVPEKLHSLKVAMDCIISSVMRGRALYRNHMGITAGPGKVLKFQRLGETIYPANRSACR